MHSEADRWQRVRLVFQATLDRAIRHGRAGLAQSLMSQMQQLLDGPETWTVS